MKKRWLLLKTDSKQIDDIMKQTSLPRAIASVLEHRNIINPSQIDRFMHPDIQHLTNPFLLPDMQIAVDRITQAILNKETIVVFADYDVDGVTSGTVLSDFLTSIYHNVHTFIPHRIGDGYGLKISSIDKCIDNYHPTLVVTVDCGINSNEAVQYAKQRGVDIIVTDHHEPDENISKAYAVINPKLTNDENIRVLAGVGISFKLVQALADFLTKNHPNILSKDDSLDYLDLVALGTVADVAPLIGDNRILVRAGLQTMRRSKWPGIRELLSLFQIEEPNTTTIGFKFGPLINAAGRIGTPYDAFNLLSTKNKTYAKNQVLVLKNTNEERRGIELETTQNYCKQIDETFDPKETFGLVIAGTNIHSGIAGIVASRLVNRYNRPAVVINISNGTAKGSCRSVGEFDILSALQNCSSHLEHFGGHRAAAGISIRPDKIDDFRTAFNQYVKEHLSDEDLIPNLNIDYELSGSDINWDFYDDLRRLHPFGEKNPEPVWMMTNASIISSRKIGTDHQLFEIEKDGVVFKSIQFNSNVSILDKTMVDLAFTIKENKWKQHISLQLHIEDIKVNKGDVYMFPDKKIDQDYMYLNTTITKGFLRSHPDCIFVFGDNLLHEGHGGAASLRDEPNSLGFVTKKYPSTQEDAYYSVEEYLPIYKQEIQKLIDHIRSHPTHMYYISPIGSGLANKFKIYEKVIKPSLKEDLLPYKNQIIFITTQ